VHLAPYEVAIACRVVLRARCQLAVEHACEKRPVLADVTVAALDAACHAADAYVQPPVLLRHIPGVAGQPVTEEPEMAVGVLPVVLELVLQSHGLQTLFSRVRLTKERAVDRTTRPTGTDEVGSSECFVDDVRTALVADVPHRVLHDTRARALQQPGIEF